MAMDLFRTGCTAATVRRKQAPYRNCEHQSHRSWAGNNMYWLWLYKKGIKGAEVLMCNTDRQHIDITPADKKFLIEVGKTRREVLVAVDTLNEGPKLLRKSLNELKESLRGIRYGLRRLCAGMGGGTEYGSGSSRRETRERNGCYRYRNCHDAFQH